MMKLLLISLLLVGCGGGSSNKDQRTDINYVEYMSNLVHNINVKNDELHIKK